MDSKMNKLLLWVVAGWAATLVLAVCLLVVLFRKPAPPQGYGPAWRPAAPAFEPERNHFERTPSYMKSADEKQCEDEERRFRNRVEDHMRENRRQVVPR